MATSDMVRHLLSRSFDQKVEPRYQQGENGIWTQSSSPHFPSRTWALDEVLENTFYTHRPATAIEMSDLIAAHGGAGIVTSLLECMERYADARNLVSPSRITLPEDPRQLREWSLAMAMTGTMNAIDRKLIPDVDSYTVHASGSYSEGDYRPLSHNSMTLVTNVKQMLDALIFNDAVA